MASKSVTLVVKSRAEERWNILWSRVLIFRVTAQLRNQACRHDGDSRRCFGCSMAAASPILIWPFPPEI